MSAKICLVVAAAENWVIGVDNKMPWHLPKDLKFFKNTTMAKPILMGRKTFESIGRPLPGRLNIVITRQSDWQVDGVQVAGSVEAAIELAQAWCEQNKQAELMVIGGAEIYAQLLPKAERIYLTRVEASPVGDAVFPEPDEQHWREVQREAHLACEQNPYNYAFCTLERVTSGDK